jgi:ketosteroid isomerase-like protein
VGANGDLVGKAYAAFGRGDLPEILELLDDDVEWSSFRTLSQGGEFKGRDGVLKFFEGVGAAWEPLTIETESFAECGEDRVVGILRASGSLGGGKAAQYGAVHVLTLRNDRITRFCEFVDVDRPIAQQRFGLAAVRASSRNPRLAE